VNPLKPRNWKVNPTFSPRRDKQLELINETTDQTIWLDYDDVDHKIVDAFALRLLKMLNQDTFDIDYSGWAPCQHSDEERVKANKFIDEVLGVEPDGFSNYFTGWSASRGGPLEYLLWVLDGELGATPELVCDQWIAVIAKGQIKNMKVCTYIQADSFLLGVAETVRWWRKKRAELEV